MFAGLLTIIVFVYLLSRLAKSLMRRRGWTKRKATGTVVIGAVLFLGVLAAFWYPAHGSGSTTITPVVSPR